MHIDEEFVPEEDPVKCLDVSLSQDNLLEPILGLGDPRRDKRIGSSAAFAG